jgi:hypothetical protein
MDPEKFAKVLALVESDHHGEAQSALRAARIMLARAGLSFRDLASMARAIPSHAIPPRMAERPPPPVWPAASGAVEAQAADEALREQIRGLEQQLQDLHHALDRQRAETARQRGEAQRWHKLARETAERLWDMGQALESRQPKRTIHDTRREIIDLLEDPAAARLSNREIARRVGASPHAVQYWRWRLAVNRRQERILRISRRRRALWLSGVRRAMVHDGIRRG